MRPQPPATQRCQSVWRPELRRQLGHTWAPDHRDHDIINLCGCGHSLCVSSLCSVENEYRQDLDGSYLGGECVLPRGHRSAFLCLLRSSQIPQWVSPQFTVTPGYTPIGVE